MPDHVQSNWTGVALVCRKCSKRVGGGFGPDQCLSLAKALRALGNRRKGRKADFGVIETPCLKLCPKGRIVAIDARSPERWLLVKPGTPVESVAARLGLTQEGPEDGLLDR
jgi:predicted metal-binding protein